MIINNEELVPANELNVVDNEGAQIDIFEEALGGGDILAGDNLIEVGGEIEVDVEGVEDEVGSVVSVVSIGSAGSVIPEQVVSP